MMKCWLAEPGDRPSFSEISDFLSQVLNREKREKDDDEESYTREYTKEIATDYIDSGSEVSDYMGEYIIPIASNDYTTQPSLEDTAPVPIDDDKVGPEYITPLPYDDTAPAAELRPTPAPRNLPAGTSDDKVYLNL